ncbi:MAG: hypothetical protein N2439_02940 [Anaerolineae bacterium]|nr:hypothetical protein [Anaerolineae bacterium]
MIFGHVPVIFPVVLKREIRYGSHFYGHVLLLHVSLGLRVAADLVGWADLRRWGGMLNGLALLAFPAVTVLALRPSAQKKSSRSLWSDANRAIQAQAPRRPLLGHRSGARWPQSTAPRRR